MVVMQERTTINIDTLFKLKYYLNMHSVFFKCQCTDQTESVETQTAEAQSRELCAKIQSPSTCKKQIQKFIFYI